MGQKYYRLELDYDGLSREDVDTDAKRLVSKHTQLGEEYRIESSKTRHDHFHVIFTRSKFTSFDEAYQIALESRCHKDWLALCKTYQVFALETDASRGWNKAREQQHPIVNKPVKMILSPIILTIRPATSLDARRLVKISEAIKDKEWEYKAFTHIWTLKPHVEIGCRDPKQATRRLLWLQDQGVSFSAEIKQNPQR